MVRNVFLGTKITSRNLTEWLSYLETLHPQSIDLSLERVKQVAQALSITKPAKKVITVAGTNGKGSVVASLSTVYLKAGYRLGAYTSPHLWRFNERIVINGQQVTDAELCRVFALIEKMRKEISLTYFEFTTLAAVFLFQEQELDLAVLEVGMGGRLDAVNIIDPDIAVITSIDLDHEKWLGDTREKIGYEKAGIMRANKPVVCGSNMPESILNYAQKLNAKIFILEENFSLESLFSIQFTAKNTANLITALPKTHLLIHNIGLSLKVLELLSKQFPVDDKTVIEAISQCRLPGRQQIIERPIWQMFDVAHNPQGIKSLAARLQELPKTGLVRAVFSMLCDKDVKGSVAAVAPYIDVWYVAGLDEPRGMTTNELALNVRQVTKKPVFEFEDITKAYQTAYKQAESQDKLVIFGSFYTVAKTMDSEGV